MITDPAAVTVVALATPFALLAAVAAVLAVPTVLRRWRTRRRLAARFPTHRTLHRFTAVGLVASMACVAASFYVIVSGT